MRITAGTDGTSTTPNIQLRNGGGTSAGTGNRIDFMGSNALDGNKIARIVGTRDGSNNGDFFISAYNSSGSINSQITLNGSSGDISLLNYGSGTNTGTATYSLAVDASGNVIEESAGLTQTEGTYTATASTSSSGITLGSLSRLEYTKTGDLYTVSGLISITTTTTGQKSFSINPTSVLPNIPEQAMTGSVADRSGNIDFGQLVDNTPTGGSDIIAITINVASTGGSAIQWTYTYNSAK